MTRASTPTMDLIDIEVFRKALVNVANEMAITLLRVSGSPMIVEARDFCTALFDADGEQLAFSGWVTMHASSSLLGVRETVALYKDDPDLARGDSFVVNDPYTSGALHQADVGVIMPIFFGDGTRDELIGWSFSNEHLLDMGGCAIGGFAPDAHDVYSEALRFPPTRVAPHGVMDAQWERFIANNVRLPEPVLNDIRGMIAAGNTAQAKMDELAQRYGVDEVRRLSSRSKDLSEAALRAKIRALPDGHYESTEWIEFDGHGTDHLLRITCTLEVDGEDLTIGFSGDPQIDALVNGAKPGLMGCVMAAMLCGFTYDIPLNEGIWRHLVFDFGAPGTVVNPVLPAPVSESHMAAGFRAGKAFTELLTQVCSLSEDPALRSRVAGVPHNAVSAAMLLGLNQHGRPGFMVLMATCIGNGGGAQTVGDGQDNYGAQCMQGTRIPDVEVFEGNEPGLVLYRQLSQDSGGPGYHRGGLGLREATVLWHSDAVGGTVTSRCNRAPARGFAGGQPGGTGLITVLRDTDVVQLMAGGRYAYLDDVTGTAEHWPSGGNVAVRRGDIVIMQGGGGGGLGDPLLRPEAAVAEDVRSGRVSRHAAEHAYGVLLTPDGSVDTAATASRRAELRKRRIGGAPAHVVEPLAAEGADLTAVTLAGRRWTCGRCAHDLGAADENWRPRVPSRERPVTEAGADRGQVIKGRGNQPPVLEREYWCPNCACALTVDIAVAGDDVVAQPLVRAGNAG